MIGKIENERALKELVAGGLFPCIKRAMQKYEDAPESEKYLYGTAYEIGEYVDTYHKLFLTGNSVEIVREGKCHDQEHHEQ